MRFSTFALLIASIAGAVMAQQTIHERSDPGQAFQEEHPKSLGPRAIEPPKKLNVRRHRPLRDGRLGRRHDSL